MQNQNKHLRLVCKINLYTDENITSIFLANDTTTNDKKFYHSIVPSTPIEKKHSRSTLSFNEEYVESRAGGHYEQTVQFRFRSNTSERALESEQLKKIKQIGLILSDGTEILIGRNDIVQNRKPNVSFASDLNFTEVKFSTKSIIPASIKNLVQSGYSFTYPFIYTA